MSYAIFKRGSPLRELLTKWRITSADVRFRFATRETLKKCADELEATLSNKEQDHQNALVAYGNYHVNPCSCCENQSNWEIFAPDGRACRWSSASKSEAESVCELLNQEFRKLTEDIAVVFLAREIAKLGDRPALEEIRRLIREATMRQMKRFSRER